MIESDEDEFRRAVMDVGNRAYDDMMHHIGYYYSDFAQKQAVIVSVCASLIIQSCCRPVIDWGADKAEARIILNNILTHMRARVSKILHEYTPEKDSD
jgi:hypothetical protein